MASAFGWDPDKTLHEIDFPLLVALNERWIREQDADRRFRAALHDKELPENEISSPPLPDQDPEDNRRSISAWNAMQQAIAAK